MKKVFLASLSLFLLTSFTSDVRNVTLQKGAPMATTIRCYDEMQSAIHSHDDAYLNSLIASGCVGITEQDYELTFVDHKVSTGRVTLRIPGTSHRVYVHSAWIRW